MVVLSFRECWKCAVDRTKFRTYRWNLGWWLARKKKKRKLRLDIYCPGPRSRRKVLIRGVVGLHWRVTGVLGSAITEEDAKADGFESLAKMKQFIMDHTKVDGKKMTEQMFLEHEWGCIQWDKPDARESLTGWELHGC